MALVLVCPLYKLNGLNFQDNTTKGSSVQEIRCTGLPMNRLNDMVKCLWNITVCFNPQPNPLLQDKERIPRYNLTYWLVRPAQTHPPETNYLLHGCCQTGLTSTRVLLHNLLTRWINRRRTDKIVWSDVLKRGLCLLFRIIFTSTELVKVKVLLKLLTILMKWIFSIRVMLQISLFFNLQIVLINKCVKNDFLNDVMLMCSIYYLIERMADNV